MGEFSRIIVRLKIIDSAKDIIRRFFSESQLSADDEIITRDKEDGPPLKKFKRLKKGPRKNPLRRIVS